MKALHINSTLPFQGAEFFIEDPIILCTILSALMWRKLNGEIKLYTDKVGYDYYKRVGLLGRGETYAIIRMDENWILISLRGAAGWIARPSGDPTGTARMRTADVLRAAQQYLLATDTWSGNTRITAETLKNYYSFAEYDATTREWLVTFESWREDVLEVIVDDDTGRVLDNEDVYG